MYAASPGQKQSYEIHTSEYSRGFPKQYWIFRMEICEIVYKTRVQPVFRDIESQMCDCISNPGNIFHFDGLESFFYKQLYFSKAIKNQGA